MSPWILLGIAVGLSMDAAAVTLAASIRLRPVTWKPILRMAAAFGFFQFLMPVLGWLAGSRLVQYIQNYDHWVAFGLLVMVGGHMLWESFEKEREDATAQDPSRGLTLLLLSVATSLDALAVGLSFSVLHVSIWMPAVVIGLVTFLLSVVAGRLGGRLGLVFGKSMDRLGGLILIAIGVKILIDHLR